MFGLGNWRGSQSLKMSWSKHNNGYSKTLRGDSSEEQHTGKQLTYNRVLASQEGDVKIRKWVFQCGSRAMVLRYVSTMEPSLLCALSWYLNIGSIDKGINLWVFFLPSPSIPSFLYSYFYILPSFLLFFPLILAYFVLYAHDSSIPLLFTTHW